MERLFVGFAVHFAHGNAFALELTYFVETFDDR
jgi:hypothetical protein